MRCYLPVGVVLESLYQSFVTGVLQGCESGVDAVQIALNAVIDSCLIVPVGFHASIDVSRHGHSGVACCQESFEELCRGEPR